MKIISIPTSNNDVYMLSDSHLSHKNIVRGVSDWKDLSKTRDFSTIEEHDETIIQNINAVVKKHDYLIHHGDFVLGGKGKLELNLAKINCDNIIWILGNHDGVNTNFIHPKIKGVYDYQIFIIADKKFVCFHYPIKSFINRSRGWIHTFGHTHQSSIIENYNKIHVGLDSNNLKPLSLDEILNYSKESTLLFDSNYDRDEI